MSEILNFFSTDMDYYSGCTKGERRDGFDLVIYTIIEY